MLTSVGADLYIYGSAANNLSDLGKYSSWLKIAGNPSMTNPTLTNIVSICVPTIEYSIQTAELRTISAVYGENTPGNWKPIGELGIYIDQLHTSSSLSGVRQALEGVIERDIVNLNPARYSSNWKTKWGVVFYSCNSRISEITSVQHENLLDSSHGAEIRYVLGPNRTSLNASFNCNKH